MESSLLLATGSDELLLLLSLQAVKKIVTNAIKIIADKAIVFRMLVWFKL